MTLTRKWQYLAYKILIAQWVEHLANNEKVADSNSAQDKWREAINLKGSRLKIQGSKVPRIKNVRCKDARLIRSLVDWNVLKQVSFSFSLSELFRLPAWEGKFYI